MSGCGRADMNAGYFDHVMDVNAWVSTPALVGGGKALAKMNKNEVYAVAKRMEIKGRSTMTKEELVSAIRRKAAALRKKRT